METTALTTYRPARLRLLLWSVLRVVVIVAGFRLGKLVLGDNPSAGLLSLLVALGAGIAADLALRWRDATTVSARGLHARDGGRATLALAWADTQQALMRDRGRSWILVAKDGSRYRIRLGSLAPSQRAEAVRTITGWLQAHAVPVREPLIHKPALQVVRDLFRTPAVLLCLIPVPRALAQDIRYELPVGVRYRYEIRYEERLVVSSSKTAPKNKKSSGPKRSVVRSQMGDPCMRKELLTSDL
ncbi:MAG: hypothetical protein JXR37_01905 [Kiritimatiellae bacterium]|nr:hypothetical protein [Kiritimatiellia bacterium]